MFLFSVNLCKNSREERESISAGAEEQRRKVVTRRILRDRGATGWTPVLTVSLLFVSVEQCCVAPRVANHTSGLPRRVEPGFEVQSGGRMSPAEWPYRVYILSNDRGRNAHASQELFASFATSAFLNTCPCLMYVVA